MLGKPRKIERGSTLVHGIPFPARHEVHIPKVPSKYIRMNLIITLVISETGLVFDIPTVAQTRIQVKYQGLMKIRPTIPRSSTITVRCSVIPSRRKLIVGHFTGIKTT